MKFIPFIFFLGITFFSVDAFSQEAINQLDKNGEPHGVWKKYFEGTDQLRYEGQFENGKEVGEFKFYCEDCKDKPVAIKNFKSKDGVADVKYVTKKGAIISEGK